MLFHLLLCAPLTAPPQEPTPPAEAPTRPHVVLVCWDTVRADHLTPYGYRLRETTPFLAELAGRGLLFEDTWATAGWTKPSVSSYLTGTVPARHGVYEGSSKAERGIVSDVLPEEALTLAEVFSANGYRTAAFVKNGHLRPGLGLDQGFDHYQDRVGDSRDIRWAALDWLDTEGGDGPIFLYLHTIDAHWPWDVPDDYAGRFAPLERVDRYRDDDSSELFDRLEDGEEPWGESDEADLRALYDGALRYQDDQLRLLFLGLEQRGMTDDLVFAFVSDHGESLGDGGRFGHGHGLDQELLHVPFLLLGPTVPVGRNTAPTSLLDLFPTLVSAASLPVPPTHEGVDRLEDPDRRTARLAEHKAPDQHLAALRRERQIVERRWIAPPPDPARIPFRVGERVEIEFRADGGDWYVVELEEGDDDVDDPAELKGVVDRLDADKLVVGGYAFALAEDCRTVYEDGAEGLAVVPGAMVKLRLEGSPPAVTRVKRYRDGTEPEFEVRGALTRIDGDRREGRVIVGSVEVDVYVDDRSELDGDLSRRLDREGLLRVLEGSADLVADGFELVTATYELVEGQRVRLMQAFPELESELVERLAAHAAKRLWSPDETGVVLDPEDIEALRRLGYVK